MDIEYFNYLTIPSGGKYRLKEINSREYITILKYLNGDNYKDFFKCLDYIIAETIDDFAEFNLVDKAYIYIAFFYYSVKPILNIKAKTGFEEFLDLADMLNVIEELYQPVEITTKISGYENCLISWPSNFELSEENIIDIDKSSILKTINGIKLDDKKRVVLMEHLQAADFNTLYDLYNKHFNISISLFQGTSLASQFQSCKINDIFYLITNIYKEGLDNYYKFIYIIIHYGRLSYSDILLMTPAELSIYYNNFVEDKEKQKESNSISTSDPNINDSLVGL